MDPHDMLEFICFSQDGRVDVVANPAGDRCTDAVVAWNGDEVLVSLLKHPALLTFKRFEIVFFFSQTRLGHRPLVTGLATHCTVSNTTSKC